MTRLLPPASVYVDTSAIPGAGRGVFAATRIKKGDLIEQCPVVSLEDPKDRDRLRRTELVNYYFLWGESRDRAAICLGLGSVYNHSYEPNAVYEKYVDDARMDFYALCDIAQGEEITVNYNGAPGDKTLLWMKGIAPPKGVSLPEEESRVARILHGLERRVLYLRRQVLDILGLQSVLMGVVVF